MGAQSMERRLHEHHFSFFERVIPAAGNIPTDASESQEPQLSRIASGSITTDASKNFCSTNSFGVSGATTFEPYAPEKLSTMKVSKTSSVFSGSGTGGLGKAVEALYFLGRSMTNLNIKSGFVLGTIAEGQKISILAFEVANTIVRGANLMQSLSNENIKYLKDMVLPSNGVQHLVSNDLDELLRIVAADKREELKVFSREVVRFGNLCSDPQWHNLDRYLNKLWSEVMPQNQLKEAAEAEMQQLITIAQYTAELYHEVHALDRFDQDYRRESEEEVNSTAVQRGDNRQILRQELKSQRKHVKSLKKKSLWSKNLEEVMEKLVDIIHFLHLKIHDAFGSADGGDVAMNRSFKLHQSLGSAGLALHYANIISQIESLVSISSSVPPNTRDTLYQGLPPNVKRSLRSRLQSFPFQVNEELTVAQIKAAMEETLTWLVPIANNTTRAHYSFGWVGEWANAGSEVNHKPVGQSDLIRIETLHHADKTKTEAYILDLILRLHQLIIRSWTDNGAIRLPIKFPMQSPTQKSLSVSLPSNKPSCTQEDQRMQRDVTFITSPSGISKGLEFEAENSNLSKHGRLSMNSKRGNKKEILPLKRPSIASVIDFSIDRIKALDAIDGVDYLTNLRK